MLFIVGFVLSFTWLLLQIYQKVHRKTGRKINKIKNYGEKRVKLRTNNHRWSSLNKLADHLTKKIDDREKIRIKLIRAGQPFASLKINEKNYTSFKILIFIFTTIFMLQNNGLYEALAWGISSMLLVEWYVSRKRRKRHKEIEKELDALVSATVDFLEQGFTINEIFTMIIQRIDRSNPLFEEVARLNVLSGSNIISTNTNKILDEFKERIGMEEIDNYTLALKQYEVAGKAIKMLRKQLELVRSEKNQKKKRETQVKSNLNSVAITAMVISIVIIILVPLLISISEYPIFN